MNSAALRTLIIYAVVLPLAVFIGWMAVDLANWDRTSFAVMAAIIFVLLIPVMLKWHYPILVFSLGASITIFFLPGQPALWMLMAALNFGLAILRRIMQKQPAFLSAPPITITLVILAVVVVVTAKLTGGMGLQSMGAGTVGGRSYYYIFAAIVAYFALASLPIPAQKHARYVNMYFLSTLVTGASNLIYFAGPAFYFLFLVFPMGFAAIQATSEGSQSLGRIAGFTSSALAIVFWQLASHGLRKVLGTWWRLLLIIAAIGLGTLGGYRSIFVLLGLIVGLLFVMEGLWRTRFLPIGLIMVLLSFAVLVPFASKLPTPAQRAVSFLPFVEVDPFVERDAAGSLEWRYLIWRAVLPDLPKYAFLGKGYAINPTEMYLADEAVKRGRAPHSSLQTVTQDYHNGPLSVYVPFGGIGALAFLAFLIAGTRALYLNYGHGTESLRTANRFLFAFFLSKMIFFVLFFGGFASDLYQLTSIVGLSVALNRGICRRPSLAPHSVPFRKITGEEAMTGAT